MRTVFTESAPKPAGHYVQAYIHEPFVFISGQLPINPETGEQCKGAIEEQTKQVLHNMLAVAQSAGSDAAHIIKTTVYIADIALWNRVDQVYADFFGDHRPARAVVPTSHLHYGFQIEVEAVAVLP